MLLCCKKPRTLPAPESLSTQSTKTRFLTFIFVLLFKCLQYFHSVTLYVSPCYKEMIFLSLFQVNKREVSVCSGGDLRSGFICSSQGLNFRGALPDSTGTAGSACLDKLFSWFLPCTISQCDDFWSYLQPQVLSTYTKECRAPSPKRCRWFLCCSLVAVSPAPSHAAPRRDAGLPALARLGPEHSTASSQWFLQAKDTVNSPSIIIPHITWAWLA